MGEIFISYSSKDNAIATKLYNSLQESKFTCWFAPRDIPPGGDYATRITQAIDKFRFVLVIVSRNSGLSEHVKREVVLALENKKIVIPFRVDSYPLSDWMRYFITPVSWLEASETDLTGSIEKLIEKIREMDNLPNYEKLDIVTSHYGENIQNSEKAKDNLKQKLHIYKIPNNEITRAVKVYEPFPNYEIAKLTLDKKNILVLNSSKQTGKYTTAISILHKTNIQNMFQIFPNITVEELLKIGFEENSGYIIDSIAPETISSFHSFAFKKLSESLEKANSYLVITSNQEGSSTEQFVDIAVKHESPVDVYKIIENHMLLLEPMKQQVKNTRTLINEINLIDYVTYDFLPRHAENLITKLISVLNGQQSKEEFLSSLQQNVNKRIHQWFQTNRSNEQYALILTLSIFNETPFTFIKERVDELKEILKQEKTSEEVVPSDLLGISMTQQLNDIYAEIYTDFVNTNVGKVDDKFVRFKTKEDAVAILLYIWNNYPQFKSVLLSWFNGLAAKRSKQINEKVMLALVELCREDLVSINYNIIQSWANHKEPYYRGLSVQLLLKVGEHKENLVYIDKLLNYWTSLSNNYQLQWSAAVAYGTPIGVHLFPKSILNLMEIYRVNHSQMEEAIYEGIQFLFDYGKVDQSHYITIIYLFNMWLEENRNELKYKQNILNFFFSILVTVQKDSLNALLSFSDIRQDILPHWFVEGLKHWTFREKVKFIVKHWFKVAHKVPELHRPLQHFIFSLIVKGGSDLKKTILLILQDIAKSSYNNAAIPIIKKIIELERK